MIAYLNVTSLEAQKRFWVSTLGAIDVGETAVELPGLRVEMTVKKPSGGTRGTPLDHLGFQVPDLPAMVERVRAAGYPIITRESLPPSLEVDAQGLAPIPGIESRVAFTLGPDDLKTEFLEYAGPPLALHHVHLFGPDPAAMRDWYIRMLGATATVRGRFISGELAGVRLSFSQASWPVEATEGRAIERVAFEVEKPKAITAASVALRDAGVATTGDATRIATTDPWGTGIEIRANGSLI